MARTFVMSDDLTVRVELTRDTDDPELLRAFCGICRAEVADHGYDTLEDAEQDASIHVDDHAR